ncbi:uncharacterized protein ACLA_092950 [Aspergillus clavatus NRRL 1]|uniref:Uncharacterized protein n=1 Tax=Aspergillus clavatus (strain ATCC 1007 / CBS 513.65 / DSM 816 / NCTC 3887 / NRRL 1 / QM 1276 / 107) TaxID=344612 RepID=A1CFE8_ASPCL|nr:uncharacterized protein ACLA_092950 [Aspergillus clavatus NRRL 1]EAW11597.1 hypothetical protein ACLA_092950 [Aspergillus clavatus NRRL 1]
MADPVSIIGTAGALANIIQLITQTIVAIKNLHSEGEDADLIFLSLIGQLLALHAALAKIKEWVGNNEDEVHYQHSMDLEVSIDCCQILLGKLDQLVSSLRQADSRRLDFQSMVKLVFGNQSIDGIQKLLEQQGTLALVTWIQPSHF